LDGVEGGGGFAASARTLRVALMTCVASTVLSRAPSASAFCVVFVAPADFVFVVVARAAVFVFGAAGSASGSRSSLSVTTVAGVHVEAEETAALTASTFACSDAMSSLA